VKHSNGSKSRQLFPSSFINQNTFYQIQRTLVLPTINSHFKENIEEARKESIEQKKLIIKKLIINYDIHDSNEPFTYFNYHFYQAGAGEFSFLKKISEQWSS